MKKTITMIVLSILMVLGVGISRLNVSAANAETNQKLDINKDGVIDDVDIEMVKSSLKTGKKQYMTCDWVNVEKAVQLTKTTQKQITEDIGEPIASKQFTVRTKDTTTDKLSGQIVHFTVRIEGEFTCEGVSYTKETPLEEDIRVKIGDEWTSKFITYNPREGDPNYTVTLVDLPVDAMVVDFKQSKDQPVTTVFFSKMNSGKIKLEMNSEDDCVGKFRLKLTGEFEYKGKKVNEYEEVFKTSDVWESEEIYYTGESPKFVVEALDNDQWIELSNASGEVDDDIVVTARKKALAPPIVASRLAISSIGANNTLDGHWTEFKVTLTGDFTYEGVSYVKEHPLVVNVRNIIGGEDWISGDIKYCGEAPTYEIAIDSIPYGVKIVNVYRNEESLLNENVATITGVVGERADCVFVFDSKYNFSRVDVNSRNSMLLEKLIDSKEIKMDDNDGKIVFTTNNEEIFQFDGYGDSLDSYYFRSFTAIDKNGKSQVFEIWRNEKHYILLKGISDSIVCDYKQIG